MGRGTGWEGIGVGIWVGRDRGTDRVRRDRGTEG